MYQLWSQYLEHLRYENSQLSAFWMSYIHLVGDVLLGLIHASREGNWLLHLYVVRHMISWCFACDKFNYVKHPDVHRNFMEGYFSVQLASKSLFGMTFVDHTIEVTVNKDKKTTAIMTSFSLKTRAVNRFWLTEEYRCVRSAEKFSTSKATSISPRWDAIINNA